MKLNDRQKEYIRKQVKILLEEDGGLFYELRDQYFDRSGRIEIAREHNLVVENSEMFDPEIDISTLPKHGYTSNFIEENFDDVLSENYELDSLINEIVEEKYLESLLDESEEYLKFHFDMRKIYELED